MHWQLERHAIRKNSNYKALCKVSWALQEAVADTQQACLYGNSGEQMHVVG